MKSQSIIFLITFLLSLFCFAQKGQTVGATDPEDQSETTADDTSNGRSNTNDRNSNGDNSNGGELYSSPSSGRSGNCPFGPPSERSRELLNRTATYLNNLRNQTAASCPAISGALESAQSAMTALQREQSNEVFSSNPREANCVNYESRLRQEYDFAVSLNSGRSISFDNDRSSPYNNCSPGEGFEECAQQVYVRRLNDSISNCSNTAQASLNAQTRNNLRLLTNSTLDLVRNPNVCGPEAVQSILQLGLSQATASASLAQGFGLAGLGISLAGEVLGALANSIFVRNSPREFLTRLQQDANRPELFCLYYDVQRSALQCDIDINQNAVIESGSNRRPECVSEQNALADLQQFSNQLKSQLDEAASGTTVARTNSAYAAGRQLRERLQQQVPGSENRTYLDLLQDAQREGASSTDSYVRTDALQLGNALRLYEQAERSSDPATKRTQLATSTSMLLGYSLSDRDTNSFDLNAYMTAYLRRRLEGDSNLASVLNTSAASEAVRRSNQDMLHQQRQANADRNSLDIALSSLVTTSRSKFTDQLRNLNRQYTQLGSRQSPVANMQWLGEMLNICRTTQGMSYFRNDQRNSRLNLNESPDRDYQSICAQFNCPGVTQANQLFIPFDPTSSQYGDGEPEQRFQRYQCALIRNSQRATQRLENNLRTSGTICGQR
jgi:hypothetical protein